MVPSADDAREPADGGRIGHYLLLEQIRRSHVGTVYLGVDESDGTPVLVKVGWRGVSELRAGAADLQGLDHPGIVPIRQCLRSPEGSDVLVQDVPRGRALAEAVAALEGNYRAIAGFVREAALVLDHAHALGVTHGDICERTLLIGDEDQPLFSEFGMGVVSAPVPPGADGAQNRERKLLLEERADLFGLGMILYFLLSGRCPTHQPAALLSDPAGSADDIAPIDQVAPEAPPELRAICAQALSTDPVYRYLQARTMVRDFDAYLHGRRSTPIVKIAFLVAGAMTAALFGLWGATSGGPARIVGVQMHVHRAGADQVEVLEGAPQAMTTGDAFSVCVELSKPGRVSIFCRAASGRVSLLGTSREAGKLRRSYELPGRGTGVANWWRAPPRGGVGVIVVVSHSRPLSEGLVAGVLAGAGDPPRSYTALSWHGRYIGRHLEPIIAAPPGAPARSRRQSFARYAERITEALLSDADDVVVGLFYTVGV